MSQVYFNALLASLNARDSIREKTKNVGVFDQSTNEPGQIHLQFRAAKSDMQYQSEGGYGTVRSLTSSI